MNSAEVDQMNGVIDSSIILSGWERSSRLFRADGEDDLCLDVGSLKMKIKLYYSGIEVRELRRSLKFYRSLGLKISHHGTMAHGGKFVHMKDPSSDQRLELNWYPKRSRFYQKYKNGSELDHIGFIVDDAEKWFRLLVKRGARPAARPFGDESETLAYVKDPDGIWIELVGPGRKPKKKRLLGKDV